MEKYDAEKWDISDDVFMGTNLPIEFLKQVALTVEFAGKYGLSEEGNLRAALTLAYCIGRKHEKENYNLGD